MKRKFVEDDQEIQSDDASHKPGKKNHFTKQKGNQDTKKNKSLSLNQRIRGLKRLIEKKDLPKDVYKAKKKELQELMKQRALNQEKQKNEEVIAKHTKKYGKIMFFDLQKVRRKIKQNKAQLDNLANTIDLSQEEAKKKQEAEEALTKYRHYYVYIRHYPMQHPYYSLFPSKELKPEDKKHQEEIKADIIAKYSNGEIKISKRSKEEMMISDDKNDTTVSDKESDVDALDPQEKGSFDYDVTADPFFMVDEEANREIDERRKEVEKQTKQIQSKKDHKLHIKFDQSDDDDEKSTSNSNNTTTVFKKQKVKK